MVYNWITNTNTINSVTSKLQIIVCSVNKLIKLHASQKTAITRFFLKSLDDLLILYAAF